MTTLAGTVEPPTDCVPTFASWENEGGAAPARAKREARLDWGTFAARFYPDARRHDHAPLAAYDAYRTDWGA